MQLLLMFLVILCVALIYWFILALAFIRQDNKYIMYLKDQLRMYTHESSADFGVFIHSVTGQVCTALVYRGPMPLSNITYIYRDTPGLITIDRDSFFKIFTPYNPSK